MAASDKRGLVENVKTLRRRLSLFGRTAFGKRVPPEVVDGEMEARAEFADMLGGVDELGAGLAEHVAVLRAYFANSEALAASSRATAGATSTGAAPRDGSAPKGGVLDRAVEAGTRLARERWAYLNAVVLRRGRGPGARRSWGTLESPKTHDSLLGDAGARRLANAKPRPPPPAAGAADGGGLRQSLPSSLARRRAASNARAASDAAALALASASSRFDCAADEDGELALAKGDVVTVTDASDAGWWKGTTDGGAWRPSNYAALGRQNQNRLLYLVSLYTHKAESHDDKDEWIRKPALLVLIYEGIVANVLDYDYAPQSELIENRRVYLNISQEGKSDVESSS
ncbi:hypothetical protein JL720_10172 [Aureococcus anophagefferens]|nr:hypothetical protein JL720_10172 [Aureococcus anophagefferens]